ncbi:MULTISPECIES: hypothetical protein [unclassified Sphingobium]|nr:MULTISPECIES: hypothetical protein [unclassified Sphingobium]
MRLAGARALMLEALAQLHAAGAVATAVRLQEAIDSLEWPPKNDGSPT